MLYPAGLYNLVWHVRLVKDHMPPFVSCVIEHVMLVSSTSPSRRQVALFACEPALTLSVVGLKSGWWVRPGTLRACNRPSKADWFHGVHDVHERQPDTSL